MKAMDRAPAIARTVNAISMISRKGGPININTVMGYPTLFNIPYLPVFMASLCFNKV